VKRFYKPEEGDAIENCIVPELDPAETAPCYKCAQPAYRILVVGRFGSEKRKVPLCAMHFINACIKYPEVEEFIRRGKTG
jgi:hypothetical protein